MRFPNDKSFHLRMGTLVVLSLFLEHLASNYLVGWTSPKIGVITFVLGLAWVALFAGHHGQSLQQRIRMLEQKLERTTELAELLADETRQRRALPPL